MRLIPSPTDIDPLLAAAVARYCAASVSENTVRAYRSAWRLFEAWCADRGMASLPAAPWSCAAYLADRATTLRPSSLAVHLAAIRQAHESRGHDSPTSTPEVLGVIKGIRREHGVAALKKVAITPAELRALVNRLGTGRLDSRDRALLLLGFCGGFRRSELVGLDVIDVVFKDEGLLINVRRSKTDQQRRGRTVALANGKSEDWVMQRTGHTSSIMLNRYRREAETAVELGLGWLKPLHELIPELAALKSGSGRRRHARTNGQ